MTAPLITLSDLALTTVIALDDDLLWADEYAWQPVRQSVIDSITGALLVQAGQRQAGRPITLTHEDDASGQMQRAVIDQLAAWAAIAGWRGVLTLRGSAWEVMFRHHEPPALEARPMVHYADPDGADWYFVTLKFIVTAAL